MKKLLSILPVFLSVFYAHAQYSEEFIPSDAHSPNATELGSYGFMPVSYYPGPANGSIPIFSTEQRGVPMSITLDYNTSGIPANGSLNPTGFDLVHNLAISQECVLISPTSPERIRIVSERGGTANGEQAYVEFGLTSGIIWDPNSSNMGGAPFISLAHELAHSWDRIQHGFVSERRWRKQG